ncbi:MAG: hypothetical protein CVU98_02210 [Firmicutes bacterium HGW-Firmicutes-3]|jgi:hypothetical protein|nr:MAG: hypothetical protein CVU98_02210 [Firmicutes bacterium HGW-Firmicutes-3]
MANHFKVRAELDKTTDTEKFNTLRGTIEDYVLDINLIIKNICETYGIKTNFTKSDEDDEDYMNHYEY